MTRPQTRRRGFTLIELLTVVSIIALLIGILLPSLSKARNQAKKAKVAAQLKTMETALETFQNDFGQYPDSSYGQDRIQGGGYPLDAGNDVLSGAHWLARALGGPDLLGVDVKGETMKRPKAPGDTLNYNTDVRVDASPVGIASERKGLYLENTQVFRRDTDDRFGLNGSPGTGRHVIVDAFDFPILYYRANARARAPFGQAGDNPNQANNYGKYNQGDNAALTGGRNADGNQDGWDFARLGAGATPIHPLGDWGNASNPETPPSSGVSGKTFIDYLHDHAVHEATGGTGVIQPVRPDSFILISAGIDGIYGTDDDVSNFRSGL